MKEVLAKVLEPLVKYATKHSKRIEIKGKDNGDLYLVRYLLFKSTPLSIYIHRFMRSDADTPHDHPWNFFTYIVTKGYKEVTYLPDGEDRGLLKPHESERKPGTLAYRKALDTHKVVNHGDRIYSRDEEHLAPLTVCIILKRHRIWGFITEATKGGRIIGYTWNNWMDYLGISPGDDDFDGSE